MKSKTTLLCLWSFTSLLLQAQSVSEVWVADQGNGTYKNPVIHSDYSDPDAVRVGDDFYMVSSSFNAVPGLPILHSQDLVNWELIGHALKRQPPYEHYSKVQHGNGVWAPSIRYHNKEFYIYYPDPDFGIYVTKATDPLGPWSEPVLVEAGLGLIDPCPLWDDDGKVYLVHAYAGSRAGIKSVIVIKQLAHDGLRTIDAGRIVYDGHEDDPTIEGPKLYKRNNYYYIFAPAGGVPTGWQTVLRSKNIFGPYERRVVLDQGSTSVNGPHQGAWVDTKSGEDWFLHFQDKEAYGRIVHLQPMKWINDWPVIGVDRDGDGKGEPVLTYKKPDTGKAGTIVTPPDSDEFDSTTPGLQWQWQANPSGTWAYINSAKGQLRLYAQQIESGVKNYWDAPNLLLQKLPAEEFEVTTKLNFTPNAKLIGERTGLILMGQTYASLSLMSREGGVDLVYSICNDASRGTIESREKIIPVSNNTIYLRITIKKGGVCNFSYSLDGAKFVPVKGEVTASPGKWVGAKVGLFCTRIVDTNDSGYADYDWFRVKPLK